MSELKLKFEFRLVIRRLVSIILEQIEQFMRRAYEMFFFYANYPLFLLLNGLL